MDSKPPFGTRFCAEQNPAIKMHNAVWRRHFMVTVITLLKMERLLFKIASELPFFEDANPYFRTALPFRKTIFS
jgi:hypothetical protein